MKLCLLMSFYFINLSCKNIYNITIESKKLYYAILFLVFNCLKATSYFEETVYFLLLGSQEFLVVIWTTSRGWRLSWPWSHQAMFFLNIYSSLVTKSFCQILFTTLFCCLQIVNSLSAIKHFSLECNPSEILNTKESSSFPNLIYPVVYYSETE